MTFLGFTATPLEVVCGLLALGTLFIGAALLVYWDWKDEQDGRYDEVAI